METVVKSISAKKLVNRGFLVGPYCPIYGFGAIFIILLLKDYVSHPIGLFCMAMILCSILEYFTSYVMEKLFNARWWDYSNKKFNINGRICLNTMVAFGLLGVLVMYYINPFFMKIINSIPNNVLIIIAIVVGVIFIIDVLFSVRTVSSFRGVLTGAIKDSTEEITMRVKQKLKSNNFLLKRMAIAYPNFKLYKDSINKLKKKKVKLTEKEDKEKEQN